MNILIINGPNLNMLGIREPGVYGEETYTQLLELIRTAAANMGVTVCIEQSNIEGEIINYIHGAYNNFDGIIINPAAYTHTSYAIFDALKAVNIPTVEVHISNVHKREEFRHRSITAPACDGQICGLGSYGYILAMQYLKSRYANE